MAKKTKAEAKKKRGRKTLWEELDIPSKLEAIEGWARIGARNIDMANKLGVSESTFSSWLTKHPELRIAIKKGKYESDGEVATAAHKLAVGYETTEEQAIKVDDWVKLEGVWRKIQRVEVVEVKKEVPPNPSSNQFWMKNREAGFNDKMEVTHVEDGREELKEYTEEELRKMALAIEKDKEE